MIRWFRLAVILVGLNLLAIPVWGAEYSFNGFATWKYDSTRKPRGLPIQHVWLIGIKKLVKIGT